MRLRTTLTIPLLSATLAITVPAVSQMTDDRAQPRQPQEQGQDQRQDAQQSQQQLQQPRQSEAMAGDAKQQHKAHAFARTSDLLGRAIRNAQDEELGELHDIVVEPRSGDVKYAVLSRGGMLGVGDSLYAIPMSALSKRPGQEHLIAKLTIEQLDEAQGFDADNWPDAANEALGDRDLAQPAMGGTPGEATAGDAAGGDGDWRTRRSPDPVRNPSVGDGRTSDETGATPRIPEGRMTTDDARTASPEGRQMAEDAATEAQREVERIRDEIRQRALAENTRIVPLDRENLWAHKASELTGASVAARGDDLGSVSDLIVDLNRGKLAYAIISYGGTLGVGDRLVAVPWNAVDVDLQADRVTLDTHRQTLDQLAFEGDQMPDFADQQWAQRTHRAFGTEPEQDVFGYSIDAGDQGQQQQNRQDQQQGQMQDQQGQQQPDSNTAGPGNPGSPYSTSPQDGAGQPDQTGQQQQGGQNQQQGQRQGQESQQQ